jgi:hypothetical protein
MPRTASVVIKNPKILINNVDLSDCIRECEVVLSKASVSDTSSGDLAEHFKAGLEQNKCSATLRQQFDAAAVDATLRPLWTNETEFVVEVSPVNTTNSATNPGFTFNCLLLDYPVLSGKPGDLLETKIDFVVNSVVSVDVT